MLRSSCALALLLVVSALPPVSAQADNADTANKSNNPLNLAPGANLQDFYTPKLYDTNAQQTTCCCVARYPLPPRTS